MYLSRQLFILFSIFIAQTVYAFSVDALLSQAQNAVFAHPQPTIALKSFSPQGDVGQVTQARARFSEDMVRVGDPNARNPFMVSDNCKNYGKGRWLDTKTWAYNFHNRLPVGTKCEFNLVLGLKSMQGKPVKAYRYYQFTVGDVVFGYDESVTDGVRVIDTWPSHQSYIVDDQVFLVKLDKSTDPRSLPRNVYCLSTDSPEKIPVKFFTSQETQTWLAKQDRGLNDWWRKKTPYRYRQEYKGEVKEWRALSCARRLSSGQPMRLVWNKNVLSATGQKRLSEQVLAYNVRQAFTASFSCVRQSAKSPCVPLSAMQVQFSESVKAEDIKQIRLQSGNKVWQPVIYDQEEGYQDAYSVRFAGPFPPDTTFVLSLPQGIEDYSRRPLANAKSFPLTVRTGAYPPLAKFAADFGVVESAVGAIPLTVRQLEPEIVGQSSVKLHSLKITDDDLAFVTALKTYANLDNYGDLKESMLLNKTGVTTQTLPRQLAAKEFEVLGIPVNKGLYVHEVESRYLGEWISQKQQPAYVHSLNLVTNLGVHVQMGKVNSVVWVTDLAKGQPVANAKVSVWDCYNSKQVWTGQTSAQGMVKISQNLAKRPNNPDGKQQGCRYSPWLIMAQLGDDRSFALSQWTQGIESWRFNLYHVDDYYYDEDEGYDSYYGGSKSTGDYLGHTIFDRSLLRVGETIHMQHIVRYAKLVGLSAPTQGFGIKKVVVQHNGSGEEYALNTKLNPIGNGESTWTIPKQAKLGEYCVRLQLSSDRYLHTGCFNVAAFRLPVLKADFNTAPHTVLSAEQTLALTMQLRYLNGGAYSNAPVTVRGRVNRAYLSLPQFSDYNFDSVPVMLNDTQPDSQDLEQQDLELDELGALTTASSLIPQLKQVSKIALEMEFRDPSGETQTVATSSTLWPAEVIIGSKTSSSWVSKNKPIEINFISVNTQQQPVANAPIKLLAQMVRYESHRKRTLGGYYSYDTQTIKEPVNIDCGTQTNAQGQLNCRFNLQNSGELEITAISTDASGRQAATKTSLWVSGDNEWWFEQGDDDRIDVLADKKHYQVGDVARLQVRMPFREANALVSVNRDGVLDSFVVPLSGKDSVISVPIKPDYAPNVYISALVVRGRNNEVQPTALVDLGKPAFKLGITELKVGWEGHQLGVKVSSDKESYHPREQAQVSVQVTPSQGRSALPNDTEVTLAVVDEALLELADNKSWQVLPSMMLSRAYGMTTATNQLQVVGKRHFGKKALPSGGGGGRGGATRELFDTLLLWQASTKVDAQGVAHFTVPLNDSLTRFKVVAIASSRDQFGTGSASIRNTQELQILSGLPSVVREGDNYQAEFTVRNSSEQPQNIQFNAIAEGLTVNHQQNLNLAANSAQVVTVPVMIPQNIDKITWQVTAQSSLYQDALKVSQKVLAAVPIQLTSSLLTQLNADKSYTTQIAPLPSNALVGSKVVLDMQPNLAGTLSHVERWFHYYPYACLEQKTTAAAGLQDLAVWQIIMDDLPTYLDKDGLAKFYPSEEESEGSSFLTAHVLRLAKALNWQIPEDSRNKMLNALQAYAEGKMAQEIYRHWIYDPQFDVTQRHLEVASVLAQYGRFKPKMLDSLRLQPNTWPTHLLIDWLEIVKNTPTLPQRNQKLAEVERLLKANIVQQGGTYALLKNDKERWWWYNSDELLQARLLLAVLNDKNWQNEVPLLIRGLLRHQQNGHWQGTQSNLWANFVIKRFNDGLVNVTGQTQAQLGSQQQSYTWPVTPVEPTVQPVIFNNSEGDINFTWPKQTTPLTVTHQGEGSPWLRVSTAARIPITQAQDKGYSIKKTLVPIQQKIKNEWHVGDVVRVELSFYSNQEMGWVVVNDPIPTGAVLLGRGLKRDSQLADAGTNNWWPVYVEYAADAYRAYYQYLPHRAEWQSAYTMRLNQAGTFNLPATRVEAMYAPDVYGLSPNAQIVVKP